MVEGSNQRGLRFMLAPHRIRALFESLWGILCLSTGLLISAWRRDSVEIELGDSDECKRRTRPDGVDSRLSRVDSLSKSRRFWFRLAAVLLGFIPFVIAEVTLRILGLPTQNAELDPYLDVSQLAPLFKGDAQGVYRIPNDRKRLFAPAEFQIEKPANTKRIFSLGGSTTQGEPYGPPTAFPTWLGLNLELIDPSQKWEMINCGGLSYASYRVLPILREVIEYAPDLIVVYCGQNEFLEARELSGWKQTPTFATRSFSIVRQLRIFQLATSIAKPERDENSASRTTRLQREVDALLDERGGLEKYHRDTFDAAAVVASFRWNLQQMVNVCQQHNVPFGSSRSHSQYS